MQRFLLPADLRRCEDDLRGSRRNKFANLLQQIRRTDLFPCCRKACISQIQHFLRFVQHQIQIKPLCIKVLFDGRRNLEILPQQFSFLLGKQACLGRNCRDLSVIDTDQEDGFCFVQPCSCQVAKSDSIQ